jgi:hypothetical protein
MNCQSNNTPFYLNHSTYPTILTCNPNPSLDLSLVNMSNLPTASAKLVLDWIAAHPYQTAFHVANGVILCTPAAATVPVLSAMGFGPAGPVAGKFLLAPGIAIALALKLTRSRFCS